jgi:protein-tyrosine-phosphatase
MLGYILTTLGEANGEKWSVRTAGTLVSEGHAMSARTRAALLRIPELSHHPFNDHRSRRFNGDDEEWSDAILAMEASHVAFVRDRFPSAAAKTVVLGQFLRVASLDVSLSEQVSLVASLDPDPAFDVDDPAGGDQDVYDGCAQRLWEMAQAFSALVGS